MVIAGHSHAYEHLVRTVGVRTLHVLVTGGAGGSLEDVQPEKVSTVTEKIAVQHHFLDATASASELTVEAIGLDGRALDRVVIPRRAPAKGEPDRWISIEPPDPRPG